MKVKLIKYLTHICLPKEILETLNLAGIGGALVGSFFTIVITLLLSFPIAIAASVYLEEFAPKNKITDFIEININNLAAVPSIVFGLLGLGILLGYLSSTKINSISCRDYFSVNDLT